VPFGRSFSFIVPLFLLFYLQAMSESFFKMFGSVKIVQEVSRSASPTSCFPIDTSTTTTTTTATLQPLSIPPPPLNWKSKRKHARKNSYIALKHLRKLNKIKQQQQQQFSTIIKIYSSNQPKSKSQKLLCLWPLPTITRYTILLSFIVSILNFLGIFELACSSPSYVIHRLEIFNLFVSPFLCTAYLPDILIFGWNVLILGLFEESLTHMLNGTRRFVQVFLSVVISVCTTRQAIGYLFSKSTGWAVPSLFFSDSLHECSQGVCVYIHLISNKRYLSIILLGLSPFLFALIVIQSLNIDDKYILMYGNDHRFTVRKVTLQIIMCLVNYAVKNILWWSLTGLLTGFIATIVIQTWLAQDKHWDQQEKDNDLPLDMTRGHYRPLPLWRTLRDAFRKSALVLLAILPFLFICNGFYTREQFVESSTLNQLSYDRYMFTFVIMTAPRRGNPPFLTRTLDSYIQNWPEEVPEKGTLYDRIQTIVYTHFTNHLEFDRAKNRFESTQRGQRYLKWIREEGDTLDQRGHVSKALSLAADLYQSTYVALVEDDFPVCGNKEWKQIESVIYEANIKSPNHCGVFVGTGGRYYNIHWLIKSLVDLHVFFFF
jgi:hypothetical protein